MGSSASEDAPLIQRRTKTSPAIRSVRIFSVPFSVLPPNLILQTSRSPRQCFKKNKKRPVSGAGVKGKSAVPPCVHKTVHLQPWVTGMGRPARRRPLGSGCSFAWPRGFHRPPLSVVLLKLLISSVRLLYSIQHFSRKPAIVKRGSNFWQRTRRAHPPPKFSVRKCRALPEFCTSVRPGHPRSWRARRPSGHRGGPGPYHPGLPGRRRGRRRSPRRCG